MHAADSNISAESPLKQPQVASQETQAPTEEDDIETTMATAEVSGSLTGSFAGSQQASQPLDQVPRLSDLVQKSGDQDHQHLPIPEDDLEEVSAQSGDFAADDKSSNFEDAEEEGGAAEASLEHIPRQLTQVKETDEEGPGSSMDQVPEQADLKMRTLEVTLDEIERQFEKVPSLAEEMPKDLSVHPEEPSSDPVSSTVAEPPSKVSDIASGSDLSGSLQANLVPQSLDNAQQDHDAHSVESGPVAGEGQVEEKGSIGDDMPAVVAMQPEDQLSSVEASSQDSPHVSQKMSLPEPQQPEVHEEEEHTVDQVQQTPDQVQQTTDQVQQPPVQVPRHRDILTSTAEQIDDVEESPSIVETRPFPAELVSEASAQSADDTLPQTQEDEASLEQVPQTPDLIDVVPGSLTMDSVPTAEKLVSQVDEQLEGTAPASQVCTSQPEQVPQVVDQVQMLQDQVPSAADQVPLSEETRPAFSHRGTQSLIEPNMGSRGPTGNLNDADEEADTTRASQSAQIGAGGSRSLEQAHLAADLDQQQSAVPAVAESGSVLAVEDVGGGEASPLAPAVSATADMGAEVAEPSLEQEQEIVDQVRQTTDPAPIPTATMEGASLISFDQPDAQASVMPPELSRQPTPIPSLREKVVPVPESELPASEKPVERELSSSDEPATVDQVPQAGVSEQLPIGTGPTVEEVLDHSGPSPAVQPTLISEPRSTFISPGSGLGTVPSMSGPLAEESGPEVRELTASSSGDQAEMVQPTAINEPSSMVGLCAPLDTSISVQLSSAPELSGPVSVMSAMTEESEIEENIDGVTAALKAVASTAGEWQNLGFRKKLKLLDDLQDNCKKYGEAFRQASCEKRGYGSSAEAEDFNARVEHALTSHISDGLLGWWLSELRAVYYEMHLTGKFPQWFESHSGQNNCVTLKSSSVIHSLLMTGATMEMHLGGSPSPKRLVSKSSSKVAALFNNFMRKKSGSNSGSLATLEETAPTAAADDDAAADLQKTRSNRSGVEYQVQQAIFENSGRWGLENAHLEEANVAKTSSGIQYDGSEFFEKAGGKVVAILGAGNFDCPTDVLTALFIENNVAVYKLSPLSKNLLPVLQDIFEPVIRANYLRIIPDDLTPHAATQLLNHPLTDRWFMTGSRDTAAKILFDRNSLDVESANSPLPLAIPPKPFTVELGSITPYIIVPDRWSSSDLQLQARHLAFHLAFNGGHVCCHPQVIITAKEWPQREAFLTAVREALVNIPFKHYYPVERSSYFEKKLTDEGVDMSIARIEGGFTFASGITENSVLLTEETFCRVAGELPLECEENGATVNPTVFLEKAVKLCNQKMTGSLAATIIAKNTSSSAVESAIKELNYTAVSVNVNAVMTFMLPQGIWGGHSSEKGLGSGVGKFGNAYGFYRPSKFVFKSPFRNTFVPMQVMPQNPTDLEWLKLCNARIGDVLRNKSRGWTGGALQLVKAATALSFGV